jgi:hypothetical protein
MQKIKILLVFTLSATFFALVFLSTTPRPPIKAGAPGYESGQFLSFASEEHCLLLEKRDKPAILNDSL